jgi:hypothetical protein
MRSAPSTVRVAVPPAVRQDGGGPVRGQPAGPGCGGPGVAARLARPGGGIFEIRGKDGDAIILLNLIDDLEYRTYSNMGRAVFRPLPGGGFLHARLVPVRPAWPAPTPSASSTTRPTGSTSLPGTGCCATCSGDPALAAGTRYADALRGYLRSKTIAPLPLQRLAAAHPATADAVFGKILRRPDFTWAEHGQALMRRRKAWYYEREPRPGVTVIGDRLLELAFGGRG